MDRYTFLVADVTQILERIRQGETRAADELMPVVYEELRRMAALKMSQEFGGQTLQPTALVHEAWLRLGGDRQPLWQNRAHFFGAASEAMRRIIVDHARRKARVKRGGGADVLSLEECELELAAPVDEILQVDEALASLAMEDSSAAEVVKLRYFVGLPIPEVAEVLNISPRAVNRLWAVARVRLKQLIAGE